MPLRTLLFFLLTGACCLDATAQTYRLRSLEGRPVHVRVQEWHDSTFSALALVCGTDTVVAYDYWAPERVQVVNQRFLQVTYAVRGGSNLGVRNTLFLCRYKGHLRQALKACTFTESDLRNASYLPGNPDEYKLFRIRTHLVGTTANTYRLRLTIHNEASSRQHPGTNHSTTTYQWLSFDPTHGVFCSTTKMLPPGFRAYVPPAGRIRQLKATGPVPVLALPTSTSYLINGNWYEAAEPE